MEKIKNVNITPEQIELFQRFFRNFDKFKDESIVSVKYIEYNKNLMQFFIGFNLTEGSTEFGYKLHYLIVGGKQRKLTEEEDEQIGAFLKSNPYNLTDY